MLPTSNPLHGFPGLPHQTFKWSNGLLEIPASVGKVGGITMPYLGGFYFRYLPMSIIKSQLKRADKKSPLWTYCHPYDFDAQEKDWRIKGAPTAVSILLWLNRKNTFKKLESLSEHNSFTPPFRDQEFGNDLKVINPATL